MAWRYHDFECSCGHEYQCLVDNRDFIPDPCPKCGAEGAKMLAVTRVNSISIYVPDYPGANIHRAGFAELRKPAEKQGRQVSMHTSSKKALNASNVPTAKAAKAAKT